MVAKVADLPLYHGFDTITAIALIILLVLHELAVAAGSRRFPLARNLRVVIAPLLVVFVVIAIRRLQIII